MKSQVVAGQDKHLSKAIELLLRGGLGLVWVRLCGDPAMIQCRAQAALASGVTWCFRLAVLAPRRTSHPSVRGCSSDGRWCYLGAAEFILARCRK